MYSYLICVDIHKYIIYTCNYTLYIIHMHTLLSIIPDINECDPAIGTHICDQMCTNTIGSFVCGCNSSYDLHDDGTTCIGMY